MVFPHSHGHHVRMAHGDSGEKNSFSLQKDENKNGKLKIQSLIYCVFVIFSAGLVLLKDTG